MRTESKVTAKVFTFLNDEILGGKGDLVVPGTSGLSGVIKRYIEGGENTMHCHHDQDHVFYVLQGQATFHLEKDENVVVANQYDAVLLPRMSYCWFQSSGDTKLIMLRVSNSESNNTRLDAYGKPIPSRGDVIARGGIDTRPQVPVRELPF